MRSSSKLFVAFVVVGLLAGGVATVVADEPRQVAFEGEVAFAVAGTDAESAGAVSVSATANETDTADADTDDRESGSARFVPLDADVEPAPADVGETVEIAVEVRNFGDDGIDRIAFAIDGEPIDSRWTTLDAGESTTATATTTFESAGAYTIHVNDRSIAEVTVVDPDAEGTATTPTSGVTTPTRTPATTTPTETATSSPATPTATATPASATTPSSDWRGAVFDSAFLAVLIAFALLGGLVLSRRRPGSRR